MLSYQSLYNLSESVNPMSAKQFIAQSEIYGPLFMRTQNDCHQEGIIAYFELVDDMVQLISYCVIYSSSFLSIFIVNKEEFLLILF